MSKDDAMDQYERLQGMHYGQEAMKWYGWGSPIGLSIFFIVIASIVAGFKIVFWG